MAVVALRPVEDGDLDALFGQMRDPEAVRMAAFTPEDPDDRNTFDAHMARVRSSPDITMRAVTCDGRLAGSIASFPAEGQAEVTYWIDRAAWGKGIATQARALLLSRFTGQRLTTLICSENTPDLLALTELIESGQVRPVIDQTYSLSQAPEAIAYMRDGHAQGKVVINL